MNEKCPKDLKHEYRKAWNELGATSSSSKAVESPALPLEGVHHVHGSHGLPLGVLGVGHRVPDHVLQENLQNTTSLFVDEPRDPLDAAPPSQTSNGRLGDALDVVTKNLPVSLGSSLPQALATFPTSTHCSLLSNSNLWGRSESSN